MSHTPVKQISYLARACPSPVESDGGPHKDAWSYPCPASLARYHSLSSFLGKVVIPEFWRKDCPHSQETMPHPKDLHFRYKDDGLVVVLVAIDSNMGAQNYLDANGYSWFVSLGDNQAKREDRVAEIYKVWTAPHTLLIDLHEAIRYTGYPSRRLDSDIIPWL